MTTYVALIILFLLVGLLWFHAWARSKHAAYLAKNGAWWALPLRGFYFAVCATSATVVCLIGSDPYQYLYYYDRELDGYPDMIHVIWYVSVIVFVLSLILLSSVRQPDAKASK